MPSEFIPWVVLSMALIIILGILFIGIARGISGSIGGVLAMTRVETTMVAVLHTSGDEYYVEVVWTWAPTPIKPLYSPMARPYHHQPRTNAVSAQFQRPIGTASILLILQVRPLVY
ncbi:hypothetical protein [Vulcanisaeta sp. JCM 16161]|uniref:hypothetical protein n=1 Tax=Vulcanisaeta sp. JCM 16161 TaxID=1295372 RepID=UPI0006CF72E4|nr:hypothetical protein [Vulcanisaeta sp. JCM 16161]